MVSDAAWLCLQVHAGGARLVRPIPLFLTVNVICVAMCLLLLCACHCMHLRSLSMLKSLVRDQPAQGRHHCVVHSGAAPARRGAPDRLRAAAPHRCPGQLWPGAVAQACPCSSSLSVYPVGFLVCNQYPLLFLMS